MRFAEASIPAWIGSILTGVSVMIAALAYYKSVRDRRIEHEDSRRSQASRIHAWVDNPLAPIIHKVPEGWIFNTHRFMLRDLDVHIGFAHVPKLNILNASEDPVYNCQVAIEWDLIVANRDPSDEYGPILAADDSFGLSVRYNDRLQKKNFRTQIWDKIGQVEAWDVVTKNSTLGLSDLSTTSWPPNSRAQQLRSKVNF